MNPDDFICTDRIIPRKIRSQNIVDRLRFREIWGAKKPATNFYVVREFYQCIFPNLSIQHVEKPPCFLRKFSPDGKYLIAFSFDLTALEIYQFQGCQAAGELLSEIDEEIVPENSTKLNQHVRSQIFEKLFKVKKVVPLGNNSILLNRECSLFTNDGRYVIIGGASFIQDDARPNFYDLYTTNESIEPTVKCLIENYYLYVIDLIEGRLTSVLQFKADIIYMSHNQGVCLFNNTLAILSIQHQTIHIYEICDGTFCPNRKIGRFCSIEESQMYSSVYPFNRHAFREKFINSLKHKILVYLYRKAKYHLDNFNCHKELRLFYYLFNHYEKLRMWKMQLIDDDHLLIRYSYEQVVTLKTHEPHVYPSYYVFYNIEKSQVLAVYDSTSDELLNLFENFCDSFRNVQTHVKMQFTCSPSNNIYARQQQNKFSEKQKYSSKSSSNNRNDMKKRLLSQLPISAQSYCSSPYLDLSLFNYDDKFVSIMERPKPCGDFPIRFFARDSGLLKFRIYPGFGLDEVTPSQPRSLVAFTFHPYEPFAISVQRINTEYVVNFHIRHSNLKKKT